MQANRSFLALLAVGTLGVLVGLAFLLTSDPPHEFVGTTYLNPSEAPAFELTGDNGDRVTLEAHRGKVVLLYFGYTFCPDICPASLAELADAVSMFEQRDREDIQVMMISVDPARDTPEALGKYMNHFDESFVGLTGTEEEIAAVAADYNVFYQTYEEDSATGYLVDHWAGVYVIDREGRIVESLSFGMTGEQIADDVKEWL